jgi:hypothetical protein
MISLAQTSSSAAIVEVQSEGVPTNGDEPNEDGSPNTASSPQTGLVPANRDEMQLVPANHPRGTGRGAASTDGWDELINREIASHAAAAEDWPHAVAHAELDHWGRLLESDLLHDRLPEWLITLDPERANRPVSYRPGRDGRALRWTINLNPRGGFRSLSEVLTALFHGLLHVAEELSSGQSRCGCYHSSAFQAAADALGVPVTRKGRLLQPPKDGRFAECLMRHGVALDAIGLPDEIASVFGLPATSARPSLVGWVCRCTKIWAARRNDVSATCGRCQEVFRRVSPLEARDSAS